MQKRFRDDTSSKVSLCQEDLDLLDTVPIVVESSPYKHTKSKKPRIQEDFDSQSLKSIDQVASTVTQVSKTSETKRKIKNVSKIADLEEANLVISEFSRLYCNNGSIIFNTYNLRWATINFIASYYFSLEIEIQRFPTIVYMMIKALENATKDLESADLIHEACLVAQRHNWKDLEKPISREERMKVFRDCCSTLPDAGSVYDLDFAIENSMVVNYYDLNLCIDKYVNWNRLIRPEMDFPAIASSFLKVASIANPLDPQLQNDIPLIRLVIYYYTRTHVKTPRKNINDFIPAPLYAVYPHFETKAELVSYIHEVFRYVYSHGTAKEFVCNYFTPSRDSLRNTNLNSWSDLYEKCRSQLKLKTKLESSGTGTRSNLSVVNSFKPPFTPFTGTVIDSHLYPNLNFVLSRAPPSTSYHDYHKENRNRQASMKTVDLDDILSPYYLSQAYTDNQHFNVPFDEDSSYSSSYPYTADHYSEDEDASSYSSSYSYTDNISSL